MQGNSTWCQIQAWIPSILLSLMCVTILQTTIEHFSRVSLQPQPLLTQFKPCHREAAGLAAVAPDNEGRPLAVGCSNSSYPRCFSGRGPCHLIGRRARVVKQWVSDPWVWLPEFDHSFARISRTTRTGKTFPFVYSGVTVSRLGGKSPTALVIGWNVLPKVLLTPKQEKKKKDELWNGIYLVFKRFHFYKAFLLQHMSKDFSHYKTMVKFQSWSLYFIWLHKNG